MKISVLIPTYARPDNLHRVLVSLQGQVRPADEIVLAVRQTDTATREFLARSPEAQALPIRVADAPQVGGVIGAMNAGIAVVTGDVMALTDDDTAPHADWIQKIEAAFVADPRLGALGGLDLQPDVPVRDQPVVGILQWYGRTVGNHHLGTGPVRDVDFVKGANCAYRTEPLRKIGFDTRLWGAGAQVHFELVAGLAFRRAGWRVAYDPALLLDHFPAVRHDNDQRGTLDRVATLNTSHNGTLAVYEHLAPLPRMVFVLWAILVGTHGDPGLVQAVRFLISQPNQLARVPPTLQGRFAGIGTALRTKRPETIPPPSPTSSALPVAVSTE